MFVFPTVWLVVINMYMIVIATLSGMNLLCCVVTLFFLVFDYSGCQSGLCQFHCELIEG